MKIALLGDFHAGIRSDRVAFIDLAKKFLDNVFFPTLEKENITTTISLGDLVDRRKYINYYTASRLRKDLIRPLFETQEQIYWILGNHDIYYKNELSISAGSELFGQFKPKLTVIDRPQLIMVGNTKIVTIPWITDENRNECEQFINSAPAKILLGHFEMANFEMQRGIMATHGYDVGLFANYDFVGSGHYHHKSSSGNFHYVGNSYELSWADYNDRKGFHILDTETKELTFYENPYTIFKKVFYDDKDGQTSVIPQDGFESCADKIVKVIIKSQTNMEQWDWFLSSIEKEKPLELQIVQDHLNFMMKPDGEITLEGKDTLSIIQESIDAIPMNVDKGKLSTLFRNLYNQSIEEIE